jgi:hypothetical protein
VSIVGRKTRASGRNFERPTAVAFILWLLVALLVVFWLIGAILDLVGGIIHFVLIAAIAIAIFAFLKRRL